MERRLAAILAADVVGYSRLMGEDEAGTVHALKALRKELVAPEIASHNGRVVKLIGDGLLAEFASVVDAVNCAVAIQSRMPERNLEVSPGREIVLRIGINLGDIVVDGRDIYGDGVNVAARIENLAEPGGISLSGYAYDHAEAKVTVAFEDTGEHDLKNITKPVRVYRVVSSGAAAMPTAMSAEPARFTRPSIAVMPFTNMSGDPEQEYFADGITEDIITDLSKISGLSVVARNSVFTYKGQSADVREVSRLLHVATVLEGSVRKSGQRIRITAQLINGKDGIHLWADRYDRDLNDIFAIQDEITRTIVEQLKIKLLPNERQAVERTPTENVEAYTYYLRGRQFFHRHSRSYYELAKRMFAKAVELDPRYARAYAGIADCEAFLYLNYNESVSPEKILATSAKALDLERGLAEAHASRGLALSIGQRFLEAEAEYEQAIELNPSLYEAFYFFARTCFAQGKLERAAELYERALEIKPDDYQSQTLLVGVHRSLGNSAEEAAGMRKAFELAQHALVANPENPRPAYLGAIALAELGEEERAREWASRALAIDPEDVLTQYNVACVHALLGDVEPAIDLLETLLPNANHETRAWVKHDSDFALLHGHPRWKDVIALTA
jgi:adenylate cyclase